jgi:hypothetical protein
VVSLVQGKACQGDLLIRDDQLKACQEQVAKAAEAQSASDRVIAQKDAEIGSMNEQITAVGKERDDWKLAANGGTWKHKLAKAAKLTIGCVIGAGAGALAAHGQAAGTVAGFASLGAFGGCLTIGVF